MKNFLIKNWKTNLLAITALIILGLYVLEVLSTEQLITIQGFLVSTGLFLTKDANSHDPN